jgi:uncharacterized membrane protein
LAVDVALAAFNVSVPAGKSAGANWSFALTHPTILLHIVVAAGVLIAAAAAAITSVGRADRWWIAVSGTGLAFVLLAFGSGVEYVDSSQKNARSAT